MRFGYWLAGCLTLALLCVTAAADPVLPLWDQWQNSLKPAGAPGPEITLAEHSQTDYVIVLPEQPTTQEQKAAEALSRWLHEMTGAEFSTVSDADPPAEHEISVGRTNRWQQANLTGKSEDLGEEGYGIAVQGERLYLWGGRLRGPLYAVFALLEEELGCRWWAPGHASIPWRPTLKFRPVPRTYGPPLRLREPYYREAFDPEWSLRNRTNAARAAVPEEWGGHLDYAGRWCHTAGEYVDFQRDFEEHPEWFSLIEGKRAPRHLCLTNEEVIQRAADYVLEQTRQHPYSEMLDLSPLDRGGYCTCANCQAIIEANGGAPAAALIYFVNRVAERVEQERPDILLSTLAYRDTVDAPTHIRPRHNVAVRLCDDLHSWPFQLTDFMSGDHERSQRYRLALQGWSRITEHLFIWEYFNNFLDYLAPLPNMHIVEPTIQAYLDHGAEGIMFQATSLCPTERSRLRAWVLAKMLWDPSRSVAELMADFLWGYYQETAPSMVAYCRLLERVRQENREELHEFSVCKGIYLDQLSGYQRLVRDPNILTTEDLEEAFALFAEAERRAEGETIRHRVQLAKLPILYVKLCRGLAYRHRSGELNLGTKFRAAAEGRTDPTDYATLVDEFEEIATREQVGYYAEQYTGPNLPKLIAVWRELLQTEPPQVTVLELGNLWRFRTDPENVGRAERWFDPQLADSDWTEMRSDIGTGWESQGFPGYLGYGWYRQKFMLPADFDTKEYLYLLFLAVDEDAEVWINGKQALVHTVSSTGLEPDEIWRTPFAFDPRPFLKPGEGNVLAVRVYNRLAMGGIWQPVCLVSTDMEVPPLLLAASVRSTH